MSDDLRYDGKPLLRLLELYILHTLGQLPPAEQETLDRLAPKLHAIYGGNGQWHEAVTAAIYGGNGQWHEAVTAAVRMPAEMPATIREMWEKNLEIARTNNVPALSAQKFAELFVDENLVT